MNGLIDWFARNGVAANLLMIIIIALGAYAALARIPLEVFPEFETDAVTISITYRGATPAEVEEAVPPVYALASLKAVKTVLESADGAALHAQLGSDEHSHAEKQ